METSKFLENIKTALDEADIEYDALTLDSQFDQIGVDSMAELMIIQMVDEQYNKEITSNNLKKCNTVNDLYSFINKLN